VTITRSAKAHMLLVLVTVVWGATFVLIKSALAFISPLYFNFVRMTLATAALAPVVARHPVKMSRATVRAGALAGTFLWLGYEFQTTGLKYTTAAQSAFLTGISVILVPLWLALFWRRRVSPWTVAGVLIALLGLVLLTLPSGTHAFANFTALNRGDGLTLGCAIAFAFQVIFLGRASRAHSFIQIVFLQFAFSALFMGLTLPLLEHPWATWNVQIVTAILVTGLLGTVAAFTIQAWAQQFTSATHTVLIFSLEPVFAWITSYFVLHERLGWRATGGALCILSGVLISELKGGAKDEEAR
jgi:drug/metabolite transporter (DMT)-like permease